MKVEHQPYFHEYFAEWMEVYKKGAVRHVTYKKYLAALRRLKEIAPELKVCDLDKRKYQGILNKYAETHERQTTMDFHHHLKSVILDIIDEGLLVVDPTRRVVVKGKAAAKERLKFLSLFELQALLGNLTLTNEPDWDWFILLVAKTGLRFSEALGLTPNDFDFVQQKIKVTKTWDYKSAEGGFGETKNNSSKRTIQIDPQLSTQMSTLTRGMAQDKAIFVHGKIFNSTANCRLEALCKKANVPVISIHGLRHTHASILIFAGVSISSIAGRLGHANITTTQETYLHIIKELEARDNDKITQYLGSLG